MASGGSPSGGPSRSLRLHAHKVSPTSRFTGSSSSSGAGYVNIGSQEETLLETYFSNLAGFKFEQAREICDRDREAKAHQSSWCELMSMLGRLANAEISYFSLTFVEKVIPSRRARSRELPLKTNYENLMLELKKVRDIYNAQKGGSDFSLERKLAELLEHVIEFVSAKKEMLHFYLSFDQSNGCHLEYGRLESYVKGMSERYKDSFHHIYMKPIKSMFQYVSLVYSEKELNVLTDLLQAQRHISEWNFLPAILSIQSCETRLSNWHGMTPLGLSDGTERKQIQKFIRSRPQALPSMRSNPYLYKWWCKFHVILLAKFSLYFHVVLSEHASAYDMQYLSIKLEMDYISSFSTVVKATIASCACTVFDSNGLKDFKGPKYHFPDSPKPALTGMDSYPFMISVPHNFEFHHHRANIVSTIMEKQHQLNTSSQHVSQHDENLDCSYFMTQLDPRVTLVVITNSSSSSLRSAKDKDNIKIANWMADTAMQLRNSFLAALLRPS